MRGETQVSKRYARIGAAIFLALVAGAASLTAQRGADPGPTSYLRMKVLVVVYTHSFTSTITAQEVANLKRDVAEAQAFFWRNSRMNLHLAVDQIQFDRFLARNQFLESNGRFWLPHVTMDKVHSVRKDLIALGLPDDSYDAVFLFWAWKNGPGHQVPYGGTASWVNQILGKAALARVPMCWGKYTNYVIHEFLHILDVINHEGGFSEFPNPDSCVCPAAWSDNTPTISAWLLRSWPDAKYLGLTGKWGTYVTIPDQDRDGFADRSPPGDALCFTEASLGSSPTRADTDGDGLSDRDEAIAGLLQGANPRDPDTDGDGRVDGADPCPLDAFAPIVPPGSAAIDGQLTGEPYVQVARITGAGVGDATVDISMSWDANFIYVAAHLVDDRVNGDALLVQIDLDGDGHVYGDRNLDIRATIGWSQSGPCGIGSQVWLRSTRTWSNTLLPASSIVSRYTRTLDGCDVELAIPRTPALQLVPAQGLELRTKFSVFEGEGSSTGSALPAFDRFRTLTLDGVLEVETRGPGSVGRVSPVLFTSRPVLGGVFGIDLVNAPFPSSGALYLSFEDARRPVRPIHVPGGPAFRHPCPVYVDVANPANLIGLVPIVVDPEGAWKLRLPLPSDPRIEGLRFILQAMLWPSRGGFTPSNGLTGVLVSQ
jgi:hypothetical protein